MQETQEKQVPSLGREDSLEKEMATHSTIFAWKSPWTEESGRLQSIGSQRVRQNSVTEHDNIPLYEYTTILFYFICKICIYLLIFGCARP